MECTSITTKMLVEVCMPVFSYALCINTHTYYCMMYLVHDFRARTLFCWLLLVLGGTAPGAKPLLPPLLQHHERLRRSQTSLTILSLSWTAVCTTAVCTHPPVATAKRLHTRTPWPSRIPCPATCLPRRRDVGLFVSRTSRITVSGPKKSGR